MRISVGGTPKDLLLLRGFVFLEGEREKNRENKTGRLLFCF